LSGEGSQHDGLSQWQAEGKALIAAHINVTDEAALLAHINMLQVGTVRDDIGHDMGQ